MNLKYIENIQGIYMIENLSNKKVYIGSSNKIRKRIYMHISELKRNIHHSIYLQRSYNLSSEKFVVKILEPVKNSRDLKRRELYWINFFKSYKSENGYNICRIPGITKYYKHSEDSKKLISVKRGNLSGKNNPFYGKKHLKLTIDRIKKSKVGNQLGKLNPNFDNSLSNESIKSLLENGNSIYRIAKLLNREYTTIRKRVEDFNLNNNQNTN